MGRRKKTVAALLAAGVLGGILTLGGGSVKADNEPVKAHPNAVVYQAEDASMTGGARKATDHTGYTGTGFAAGFDNSGTAKVSFTVNAASAGTYYLSFRYSAGDVGGWPKNRTLALSVGNEKENVTFTGTDSTWNTWEELIVKKELVSGNNTISLSCITDNDNSDAINLDKLSVWKYSGNPSVDALLFTEEGYNVSVGASYPVNVSLVNSNGVVQGDASEYVLSSSDESVLKVDNDKKMLIGVKEGNAVVTASQGSIKGTVKVTVTDCPVLTAYCSDIEREVPECMFGYILTPNYDVPDSRLTLLGNLLNRETLPVQNFQAIGDMDGSYYTYEGSVLERHLEAYRRAKACGAEWYMLVGHNPSWATASGGPMDTTENKPLKTPKQIADFKQYAKDVFQYMKDNGAKPDYADLTNEYWTGTEETFKAVWEALREVYQDDIPAVGPGGVGYDGIPDFYIPYVAENDLSLEGPSWHAFWTSDTYVKYSQLLSWADGVRKYQKQYPKANGEYVIWEENNAGSKNATDWTRSMSNVIRTGVDRNIKGCMEAGNANGMSDIITTNVTEANPAARRTIWWVYYMFGQMSGDYVDIETTGDESFTGAVAVDKEEKEIKAVIAKNDLTGPANIVLNDIPFDFDNAVIDLYKITDNESDGLTWQERITPSSYSDGSMAFSIDKAQANDTWFAVVKNSSAKPGFFAQISPDDGEAVGAVQTFTWQAATDAASYNLNVSENKDLSSPVIKEEGIKGTSFTSGTALNQGTRYYWSVTAVNANGSRTVSHDVKYSFIVCESADVPGQFGPYMPSVGAKNEDVNVELKWSVAYDADSYHVIVSENEDMSNPVIDEHGIKTVRDTGQFGSKSQNYYKIKDALSYKTKYYWMVYAVNENGERPMNGVPHYFTTKAEGDAPCDFELVSPADGATDVDARTVLEWEPSDNAFFYELKVYPENDADNPVISREYMIYNRYTIEQGALEPGKTYCWEVTAYTKDKKKFTQCSSGSRSFTVKNTPCSPLLYSEVPDDGTVTLYFRSSIGADSYNIYYGKEEGVYTRKITGVTGTDYTVKGLKAGQDYYFGIAAVNSYGESSIWNVRKETPAGSAEGWKESDEEGMLITPAVTPPDKDEPDTLVTPYPQTPPSGGSDAPSVTKPKKPKKTVVKKAVSKKKGTILIKWKKVKADGYQVMLAKNKKMTKGKKAYTLKGKKKVSKTVKKLKSGKKYYVKVRAYNGSGNNIAYGSWSKKKVVKVH